VEVVGRLVSTYDIVVESFRPGVMARLGLGYEALAALNPAVIYCSLSGYGQTGPWRDRAGHDINYLALSGLMSYSGRKEGGPTLTGMQVADLTAGAGNTVTAILAAVIARYRTGEGQYIDIAMSDGMVAFTALQGAVYLAGGEEPKREESHLNGGSLYDFYETGDGGFVAVGCLEPQFFRNFCETLGRPDLAAGGILPPDTARVKEELRAIFRTRTRDAWAEIFRDVDACVDPVLTLAEALSSDQAGTRGLTVQVPSPDGGFLPQPANPLCLSATPPRYDAPAPMPGQHTREVLEGLGYGPEEIGDLKKTGLFD
jgi:crotonobetainyl-CoA:carnitine CoA-transferase CaiB-like acyl-CoA transferase